MVLLSPHNTQQHGSHEPHTLSTSPPPTPASPPPFSSSPMNGWVDINKRRVTSAVFRLTISCLMKHRCFTHGRFYTVYVLWFVLLHALSPAGVLTGHCPSRACRLETATYLHLYPPTRRLPPHTHAPRAQFTSNPPSVCFNIRSDLLD